MIDSLLKCKSNATRSTILHDLGLRSGPITEGAKQFLTPYILLTLHRPANVDNRDALLNILEGLEEVVTGFPVIFPAHPRTQSRIAEFELNKFFESQGPEENSGGRGIRPSGIHLTEPLGYIDFLCVMMNATLVVTDSGGIQEETTCLDVPCVTVRENTERPVTIEKGTNVLAGVTKEGIRHAIRRQLRSKTAGMPPELWDGCTADRIVEIICEKARRRSCSPSDLTNSNYVSTNRLALAAG